jgi:hypothetical protein
MFSIADLLRKAEHAPTAPGAYILLIRLAVPVEVALPAPWAVNRIIHR